MPTILIEDLEPNCQVTVIVSDLYEIETNPNPPAEAPVEEKAETVWLVSKKDST